MLRLEAERFGTAEYYEATRDGERPKARRRLAWYGLGLGIAILLLYVHPRPQRDLFLGSGDRLGAVFGGLSTARSASARQSSSRRRATTGSVCRTPGPTPGRSSIRRSRRSSTRSPSAVDFGTCSSTDMNPNIANLIQTLLYC